MTKRKNNSLPGLSEDAIGIIASNLTPECSASPRTKAEALRKIMKRVDPGLVGFIEAIFPKMKGEEGEDNDFRKVALYSTHMVLRLEYAAASSGELFRNYIQESDDYLARGWRGLRKRNIL